VVLLAVQFPLSTFATRDVFFRMLNMRQGSKNVSLQVEFNNPGNKGYLRILNIVSCFESQYSFVDVDVEGFLNCKKNSNGTFKYILFTLHPGHNPPLSFLPSHALINIYPHYLSPLLLRE